MTANDDHKQYSPEGQAAPGEHAGAVRKRRGFTGMQVLAIVGAVVLVTAGATWWLIRTYVYPTDFDPVELSVAEQDQLDGKLRSIGVDPVDLLPEAERTAPEFDAEGRLLPEQYSEDADARDIRLSERELNALVGGSPEFARRFAIDLSSNLASAKLLVPLDQDFPILGGRTLRINAGVELDYRNDRPVVILRGISVMGVPIPDAWLGNLRNVDLVRQFGGDSGFWQAFAAGIELLEIEDGQLHLKLRE